MYEAFIDLDELVVRCRDKQAKQFIKEAVACYKAGAYRSCIVATWNAVVFDFLHKLRELQLLGDKEASQLLEKFEKLSSEKKVKELWQFESDIPKTALKPFELISNVEMSDIERLFEDRSRCAHPSMTSLEEPFEATAELARYHLRSAVTHLLERPPVQGRAARERIFKDIKSEYFPTDSQLAITYFQKSPLARARLTLIKDIVLGLTVSLLTENLPDDERARQFSAIDAISSMYPEKIREILNDKLSDIILNKVNDENWDKVIIYLGKINIWDYLTEPCQIKGVAFIEKLKLVKRKWYAESASRENLEILLIANRIFFLKDAVKTKLQLPLKELIIIKPYCQDKPQYHLINEQIKPLLEKAIPQANFDELISMMTESSCSLNEKIQPYLIDKIKGLSLEELLDTCQYYKRFSSKKKLKILTDILETPVTKLFEQAKVDDLIEIIAKYYNDKLFEELFKSFLKDNIPKIIHRFKLSSSYPNAASNANLLNEAADFISLPQWKEILKAFFESNEIYCSHGCTSAFESLFKKSIELDVSVKPYWLSFREKLNSLNDLGTNERYINSLKNVIDSQLELE